MRSDRLLALACLVLVGAPAVGWGAPAAPPPPPAAERDEGAGTVDVDDLENLDAAPPKESGPASARSRVPQRRDAETPRVVVRPPDTRRPAPPPASQPAARPPSTATVAAARPRPAAPAAQPPAVTPRQAEELIRRSREGIDFFELVDEMLDEIAHQIGREDPNLLSPMAIRAVRLSANLRPEFARTLEARLVARVVNGSPVRMAICAECMAMRSRVENGSWMVTVGAARQDDLRRLGETSGIKTFMDVDFTFSPESNVIWMDVVAYRASDGGVVWTDAYRSDGTTAALLRTGRRIPSRAERDAELQQKIAARPNYGYSAALGLMQLGYTAPTGNVTGAQVTLRFHERFGEDQGNLFGLSAGVFTTGPPNMNKMPQALNSILLGAYYSHNLSEPNLNNPELWMYGEGGGIFSGNEGNTFYVEGGADLHLKWRLSASAGLMYVFPTQYSGYDLGGVGFRLRAAMNW